MKRMYKNKNIIARKIHDCYFLINIKDNYKDEKCRLYEINEIGYFLWEKMDQCDSIFQLADELLCVIQDDVDRSQILDDVECFVESLKKVGFVEV